MGARIESCSHSGEVISLALCALLLCLIHSLGRLPKYCDLNLIRQVHRFRDGRLRRYDPSVYLRLPGEPDASDQAGSQVDHAPVDPGHVCAGVEHGSIVGEEEAKGPAHRSAACASREWLLLHLKYTAWVS